MWCSLSVPGIRMVCVGLSESKPQCVRSKCICCCTLTSKHKDITSDDLSITAVITEITATLEWSLLYWLIYREWQIQGQQYIVCISANYGFQRHAVYHYKCMHWKYFYLHRMLVKHWHTTIYINLTQLCPNKLFPGLSHTYTHSCVFKLTWCITGLLFACDYQTHSCSISAMH